MATKRRGGVLDDDDNDDNDNVGSMPPTKMAKVASEGAKDAIPTKFIKCIEKWDLTICAQSLAGESHRWYVGSHTPNLYKFRVNSTILSALSPVFDKMLNGAFMESQTREVTLNEDHPEALTILFAVAHHKRNLLPEEVAF